MYHADAVIGLNTSGMIEAGLIGKPVLTLLSKDIPQTLQGTQDTLHFEHLLNVNGGLLHVAGSWEEHVQHLARAINGDRAMVERSRRFTEAFIRPHGIDITAAPILAEAIRSLPAVERRSPWSERLLCNLLLRHLFEVILIGRAQNRRRVRRMVRNGKRRIKALHELIVLYTQRYPAVVKIRAGGKSYRFVCHSKKEARRVGRLFTKEPGTIAWLMETLRPDDIFFDIGANIGVYSIYAAQELASGGCVYAFEPHLANAATVLENIAANDLVERIHLISAPLADRDGFGTFHYHSLESSRSSSQFGPPVMDGQEFRPAALELKYGARLDALIDSGVIPAPTVVKIDVDGLEAEIIAGMKSLLASARAPRSVQIELSRENAERIISEMSAAGYELVSRHWTQSRQISIDQGADPLTQFPHNVIFTKVATSVGRPPAALSLARAG
jgi:FkbM family methyltransferase